MTLSVVSGWAESLKQRVTVGTDVFDVGRNWAEPHRHLGRFARDAHAVGEARDWLRRRMSLRPAGALIPGSVAEDTLLMTSEITTNVLLHTPEPGGHGAFVVSAFFYARCLRISVRCTTGSAAGGSPPRAVPLRPQSAHALAEHGRGLALVDALATTWGSEPGRPGQAVYFTVDWDPVDSASTERTPAPWTGFSSQAAGW